MANKSDNIIREEARAIEVGEETGGTPQQRRQRDSWASRTGFILACVGSAVGHGQYLALPLPRRSARRCGVSHPVPHLRGAAWVHGRDWRDVVWACHGNRPMGSVWQGHGDARHQEGWPHRQDRRSRSDAGLACVGHRYAVVLGWACHYLFSSLTAELMAQSDMGAFFGGIASDFGNVGFHVAGLVITFVIMILGVSRGIERV